MKGIIVEHTDGKGVIHGLQVTVYPQNKEDVGDIQSTIARLKNDGRLILSSEYSAISGSSVEATDLEFIGIASVLSPD